MISLDLEDGNTFIIQNKDIQINSKKFIQFYSFASGAVVVDDCRSSSTSSVVSSGSPSAS